MDWFKLGVKEAIHIKRKASDRNKDKGRHQLPSVYDSIISSDRSTTSGQMTLKIGGCRSQATVQTYVSRENFVESFIDIRDGMFYWEPLRTLGLLKVNGISGS